MSRIKTNALALTATVALFMFSAPSSLATIIYEVDRTIGAGSVTGFVETDGSLGVLGAANFLDWNLNLDDGVTTFNLLGPGSGSNSDLLLSGSDLTASLTDLFFNYSSGGGTCALFQNPGIGSGTNWYALETSSFACGIAGGFAGESVTTDTGTATQARTGSSSWASVAATQVPEPGTFALFALGLVSLRMFRRKH